MVSGDGSALQAALPAYKRKNVWDLTFDPATVSIKCSDKVVTIKLNLTSISDIFHIDQGINPGKL